MNCLEYRRMLLAEGREDEAMRAHRDGCEPCAELHRDHLAFEAELRRALEVPVPRGLADGIAHGVTRGGPPRRRRWLVAAAAALVAATGAGFLVWRSRDDPMALACIDFVMKDETKSIMMGPMPREEAVRALADSLPLERIERIGRIRHVGPCPFGSATAYHIVLMVPQDKVTLLVIPDRRMQPGRASLHGMHARMVPLARGSVGVVGASAAVVESVVGAILG